MVQQLLLYSRHVPAFRLQPKPANQLENVEIENVKQLKTNFNIYLKSQETFPLAKCFHFITKSLVYRNIMSYMLPVSAEKGGKETCTIADEDDELKLS